MATTLRAAVEIHDRSTTAFDRMVRSGERFERMLDRLDRKVSLLEYKLRRLGLMKIEPKLGLDDSEFHSKMAAASAAMSAASAARVATPGGAGGNMGGGGGGGGGALEMPGEPEPGRRSRWSRFNPFRGIDPNIHLNKMNNSFHSFIGGIVNIFKLGFTLISQMTSTLVSGAFSLLGSMVEKMSGLFGKAGGMVGKFGGLLTKLGPAVGGIMGPLAGLGMIAAFGAAMIGGLAQAVIVLTSLITALLVPLAAVLPLMAGFFGGAVAIGAPMAIWLTETKKLVDAKKELQEKLTTLTPGTQEYADTLKELDETTRKLNQNGGAAVWERLTDLVSKMKAEVMTVGNKRIWARIVDNAASAVEGLMPIVGRAVTAFSKMGEKLTKAMSESLQKGGRGNQAFDKLFRALPPVFKAASEALGEFVLLLTNIATAAAPMATFMMKELSAWLGEFNDQLGTKSGMQDLRQWFKDMYPLFKDMVIVVAEFVAGFVRMGKEGAPLARRFLAWLLEVGPEIVEWIEHMAEKWGPTFLTIMETLGRFIGLIMDIAGVLADIFQPVLERLFGENGVITIAIEILETLFGILESTGIIDAAATSFSLLLSPFELIAAAVKTIVEKIQWLIDNLPNLSFPDVPDWVTSGIPGIDFPGIDGPGGAPAPRPEDFPGGGNGPVNGGGGDFQEGEYRPRRGGGHTYNIQSMTVQAGTPQDLVDELMRLAPNTPVEPGAGPSGP